MEVAQQGKTLSGSAEGVSDGSTSAWKIELARSKVQAMSFGCIDSRFCIRQQAAVRAKIGGDQSCMDMALLPGGAYGIVRPQTNEALLLKRWEARQTAFFESVEIAISHQAHTIGLVDHEKCGLCAMHGHAFPPGLESFRREQAFHTEMLLLAAEEVHKVFPRLTVMRFFTYLDKEGRVQADVIH